MKAMASLWAHFGQNTDISS